MRYRVINKTRNIMKLKESFYERHTLLMKEREGKIILIVFSLLEKNCPYIDSIQLHVS